MNNFMIGTGLSPMNTLTVPMVIENDGRIERSMDIFSRLLKDRVIMLGGQVEGRMAMTIQAQLLYLDSESSEEPIIMYINSPGGSITDGLAILDAMNKVKAPVHTICMGMAASMGAFLLSQGEPGHRYCTSNGEIMIHQPLGGFQGQATDIMIHANRITEMKKKLTEMMANSTNGKTDAQAMWDECERDNFLTPEKALSMGLIDQVI